MRFQPVRELRNPVKGKYMKIEILQFHTHTHTHTHARARAREITQHLHAPYEVIIFLYKISENKNVIMHLCNIILQNPFALCSSVF
jgi:hypothetical protein